MELNHHQSDYHASYHQILIWEWSPDYRRYNVVAWFLVHEDESPVKRNGSWEFIKRAGERTPKRIVAPIYRETWTGLWNDTRDPEHENKKLFPEKMRPSIGLNDGR